MSEKFEVFPVFNKWGVRYKTKYLPYLEETKHIGDIFLTENEAIRHCQVLNNNKKYA